MTTATAELAGPRSSISATALVGAFAGVTALLVALHQPALLRVLFPAGGFAVGLWLFRRKGFPAYLGFAWAFWFLAPGLRRIADYQAGAWDPENPISLAPFLVSGIALLAVVRRVPELGRRRFLPWICVLTAVCYGYFAGVLQVGVLPATHALLIWLVPLGLGLAIALEWRSYPECAVMMSELFFWGAIVLAAYAVIQFVNPLPWDRLWVDSAEMRSVGVALPFRIRVFSLVNGPLALATLLAAGMFLMIARKGSWRIVALALCSAALLLTLVRSVWIAGTLGLVVYLARMPRRAFRRVVIGAVVALGLVAVVPAALSSDARNRVVDLVTQRFATFGDVTHDVSFSDRSSFIDQISSVVMDSPMGHGLGSTGVSVRLGQPDSGGIRDFDSGIMAALYSLGWFAGALLLGATLYLTLAGLSRREGPGDMYAAAARAILIASVGLSLGGNVFEGVSAAVLWGFAGLLAAAQQWHQAGQPEGRAV